MDKLGNKKFKCIGFLKNVNNDSSLTFNSFCEILSLNFIFIFVEIDGYYVPFKVERIVKKNDSKYFVFFRNMTNYYLTLLKSRYVFIESCDFDKVDFHEDPAEVLEG